MRAPLTQQAYVSNPRCPACYSGEIEAEVEWDGCDGHALLQEAVCLNCGATWDEIYTLARYENLVRPTKETA